MSSHPANPANPAETVRAIADRRVLAVIRSDDAAAARRAAVQVLEAGLDTLEVTLSTPDATAILRELAAGWPSATIGAGTVLTPHQAEAAVAAGARYLVSPHLDPRLIKAAHSLGVAAIPGCLTPSEVLRAMELGAGLVKLYPASAYGVGAFRDLCRALPQVPFLPTGGIGPGDARQWLDAGATAVGIGKALAELPAGGLGSLLGRLAR